MSTRGQKAVVGVFSYADDTLKAIKQAQASHLDFRVYSPVPVPDLFEAAHPEPSPIRFFTLGGALFGLIFGFALPILCSLDYPLRVSAKDIVSIPGFVVIGYECTILFGALSTLFAMFHFCRLPDILRTVGYDPRFTADKFGIVVGCSGEAVSDVSDKLRSCGAEEVEVREGL